MVLSHCRLVSIKILKNWKKKMNNTNNNDWSILPRNKIEFYYYHVEKMKWLFVFFLQTKVAFKITCLLSSLYLNTLQVS